MEIVITTSDQIATIVADAITALIAEAPVPVIGVATGSSPIRVYEELVTRHKAGRVSFSNARIFMLDEYLGLPPGHSQAYRTFLHEHFVDHVDLPATAFCGPDVHSTDIPRACADYEEAIVRAGGIDIQLLGIGTDGHIGFNEPGSSLQSRTRIKTLAATTVADNARFFGDADAVPRHVLTQGLGTIMRARHLILIATGSHKASAVAAACEGPITASCPASILQHHPHTTVLVDDAAASLLTRASYYRATYAGKPPWQQTNI